MWNDGFDIFSETDHAKNYWILLLIIFLGETNMNVSTSYH